MIKNCATERGPVLRGLGVKDGAVSGPRKAIMPVA